MARRPRSVRPIPGTAPLELSTPLAASLLAQLETNPPVESVKKTGRFERWETLENEHVSRNESFESLNETETRLQSVSRNNGCFGKEEFERKTGAVEKSRQESLKKN